MSVRTWRELEKSELKEVRPYPMYVALLCVHPELDDIELTVTPDDLYVVAEVLGPEEALVRRSIPEVWFVVWRLRR
ncbi:hypothetical protein [Nonomuraea sp. NPDC049129]|uniref:hypothetical protein n=1 Tax=Nonomuraea sp. NPDC049129 TaxID=3155272 RepID=UPI0033D5B2B3